MAVQPENVQKTIDAIRYNVENKTDVTFDMHHYSVPHECGTSCCIAGFAYLAKHGEVATHYSTEIVGDTAQEFLGLTDIQKQKLFNPTHTDNGYEATYEEGIKVLEHLRDTGVVDWSVAGILNDPDWDY